MSAPLADSVSRALRSIDSARALFRDGLMPEAQEYMVSALHQLLHAWQTETTTAEGTSADPAPARERALAEIERAGYARLERLRAALLAAEAPAATALAAASSVDWMWAEIERLAGFSARRARTPHARRVRRFRLGGAAALLFVVLLVLAFRLWGRPRVQASSFLAESHSPAKVLDGLEATEWLLNDDSVGWVDVIYSSARTVHSVVLVNAHNVFYLDRAARVVRVTAFTEQGRAASAKGEFTQLSEARSAIELHLEATGVVRLRVEVLSYFGQGGGLAEVEVH